jgi:hypothetical protein
MQNLGHSVSDT